MGILEQIAEQLTETNKNLLTKIDMLNDKVSSLEYEITSGNCSIQNKTVGLSLEFRGKDKLNASMAAKVIGITQTELFDIVNRGLLSSIGEKKRIFLAEEVIRYMRKDDEKSLVQNSIKVEKKRNKKTIKEVINEKDLQELYAKQAV